MAGCHRNEGDLPLLGRSRSAFLERLVWICLPVGILAAVIVLLLFGWSIWTALLLVLLLACPAVMIWALCTTSGELPVSGADQGREESEK